jgi:hypothetical protein
MKRFGTPMIEDAIEETLMIVPLLRASMPGRKGAIMR